MEECCGIEEREAEVRISQMGEGEIEHGQTVTLRILKQTRETREGVY